MLLADTNENIIVSDITGKYNDGTVEVEIGKDGKSTTVKINGEEMKNVVGLSILVRPDKPTQMLLETVKLI